MTNNNEMLRHSIALWGPPHSGKTWLMKSFAKSLQMCNDFDLDFTYQLYGDGYGEYPVSVGSSPEPSPTKEPHSSTWLFSRTGKRTSRPHRTSSHTHRVTVGDDMGKKTIDLVNPITKSNLTAASSLLLMLDSTRLGRVGSDYSEEESGDKSVSSKIGYTTWVKRLFTLLNEQPQKRYVAICLTKIDLLGVLRSPWDLMEAIFGTVMKTLLVDYANNPLVNLEVFGVSSAGFLPGSERLPNIDEDTGSLRMPDRWQPYNVETPFFWLFEHVERERLARSCGRLSKIFHGSDPYKDYLEYPQLNRW